MIKYLYLLPLFCILCSCSNEELLLASEESAVELKQSAAMRSTFEAIKNTTPTKSPSKATKSAEELCFQFIYPITLKYTTDEIIVISNYEELLNVLLNETLDKHINAIGFPFNVETRNTGTQKLITDEKEFKTLVEDCGYESINYTKVVEFAGQCFTVNYPISLVVNDAIMNFSTEQEAQDFFIENFSTVKTITISYPFMVTLQSTETSELIEDDYELIYLIKDTCGFE